MTTTTPEARIERAAAAQTVADLGVDAVWIAPTETGAALRGALALFDHSAAAVTAALARWAPARPASDRTTTP